jgi:hypothetical protein
MSTMTWLVLLVLVLAVPLAAWAGIRMLRDPHRER